MKVRFFVPEGTLPQIAHGDAVSVHCDGCPGEILARVSFIAKSAEFTPPVIYSQTERAKLVFLIEALPDNPESLRVGQPVDVAIAPKPGNGKEAR
jgi:HlyD family secretion protein